MWVAKSDVSLQHGAAHIPDPRLRGNYRKRSFSQNPHLIYQKFLSDLPERISVAFHQLHCHLPHTSHFSPVLFLQPPFWPSSTQVDTLHSILYTVARIILIKHALNHVTIHSSPPMVSHQHVTPHDLPLATPLISYFALPATHSKQVFT